MLRKSAFKLFDFLFILIELLESLATNSSLLLWANPSETLDIIDLRALAFCDLKLKEVDEDFIF